MSDLISIVTLNWPSRCQFLLEFGDPVGSPTRTTADHEPDRYVFDFAPGSLVGYSRRLENEYGTQRWDYFILHLGAGSVEVPGVSAPCDLLSHMTGKQRFNRMRRWISRLHGEGHDPVDLSPDFHRRAGPRVYAKKSMAPLLRELAGGDRP